MAGVSRRSGATAGKPAPRAATLQHELSSYNTASELNDLEAILDRYSDEDTADIRRFLATRRVA